jgi:glycosyltransferase involved in cell wall biosynthesis
VDPASEWRGGQVQLALLIEGLEARGHRVALAATPRGELARRLDREVLALPPSSRLAGAQALRRHVARLRPDLVVAQSSHAHSLCVLAGLRPVVHRRVDFAVGGSPWGRWKYGRALRYVAVSEGVARVLRCGGVSGDDIRVVHDGVHPLQPLPPAADLAGEGPLVGAVGALVDHKDHRVLVEAMAELPGVRCVIAGEGRRRARLEALIRARGLEGRVRLLGQRDDVAAVLAALDLFVHPSIEEGMGQVVVEAMAAGVPTLVSDAGGLPEVVGQEGVVVPAGDARALADGIRAALASPPDAARARERAVGRFSVDGMVEGTLAAYHEALDRSRGRGRSA